MRNQYRFSNEEDPKLMGDLTPGTSQQVAPVQAPSPTVAPLHEDPPAQPKSAPVAPTAPIVSPRLPGMPAGVGDADIKEYLNRRREGFDRFGPDQRMKLQSDIDARQNSFGNKATSGLKGLADAIMAGVAGAGNPGWQQAYDDQERQFAQGKIGALKDARAMNTENVQAGMTLDQMDPSSDLSRAKQAAYAPLFQKLGYQPSALRGMSAANIDSSLALMAQFGGMEIQATIKKYELEIERARIAAASDKNLQDAGIADRKQRADAASEILKRSGNARIWGIPIPFTSDVSGKEEKAAQRVLLEQMRGENIVDVKTEAEAESHPPGTRFRLNGRTGTVK